MKALSRYVPTVQLARLGFVSRVSFGLQDAKSLRDVSLRLLMKLGSLVFRGGGMPECLAEVVRVRLSSKTPLDEKALVETLSAFGALGACYWKELADDYKQVAELAVKHAADPRVRLCKFCL